LPKVTQLAGRRAGLKLLFPVSGSTDFSLPPVQFYFEWALSELTGPVRDKQRGWAALALRSENALIFQVHSLKAQPAVLLSHLLLKMFTLKLVTAVTSDSPAHPSG